MFFIAKRFFVPRVGLVEFKSFRLLGALAVFYHNKGVFTYFINNCLGILKENVLNYFFIDCIGLYSKAQVTRLTHLSKLLVGLNVGFSTQVYLKGLGHVFRVYSLKKRKLLRTSFGYSKKLLLKIPFSVKFLTVKKLKVYLRSNSLVRLTLFVARLNKIKFRFFYKKFKGFASFFEKIRILKMNKGLW